MASEVWLSQHSYMLWEKMNAICPEFQNIQEIMSLGLGEVEKTQHNREPFYSLNCFPFSRPTSL